MKYLISFACKHFKSISNFLQWWLCDASNHKNTRTNLGEHKGSRRGPDPSSHYLKTFKNKIFRSVLSKCGQFLIFAPPPPIENPVYIHGNCVKAISVFTLYSIREYLYFKILKLIWAILQFETAQRHLLANFKQYFFNYSINNLWAIW